MGRLASLKARGCPAHPQAAPRQLRSLRTCREGCWRADSNGPSPLETHRYLYLLFDEASFLNRHADAYVLTTEGHPLPLKAAFSALVPPAALPSAAALASLGVADLRQLIAAAGLSCSAKSAPFGRPRDRHCRGRRPTPRPALARRGRWAALRAPVALARPGGGVGSARRKGERGTLPRAGKHEVHLVESWESPDSGLKLGPIPPLI